MLLIIVAICFIYGCVWYLRILNIKNTEEIIYINIYGKELEELNTQLEVNLGSFHPLNQPYPATESFHYHSYYDKIWIQDKNWENCNFYDSTKFIWTNRFNQLEVQSTLSDEAIEKIIKEYKPQAPLDIIKKQSGFVIIEHILKNNNLHLSWFHKENKVMEEWGFDTTYFECDKIFYGKMYPLGGPNGGITFQRSLYSSRERGLHIVLPYYFQNHCTQGHGTASVTNIYPIRRISSNNFLNVAAFSYRQVGPLFLRPYDISQESFKIRIHWKVPSRCIIKSLEIPFDEFPEFSNITPEPDSIGSRAIYFYRDDKIQQIQATGMKAYVKYPEKQNMQLARSFLLTMLLSLELTWLIELIIRIYRDYRTRKLYKNRTKECLGTIHDCINCPLTSTCNRFLPDRKNET